MGEKAPGRPDVKGPGNALRSGDQLDCSAGGREHATPVGATAAVVATFALSVKLAPLALLLPQSW